MEEKRMGRPPLPAGLRRSKQMAIRLTAGELKLLEEYAGKKGMSVYAWVRQAALTCARKGLC